MNQRARFPVTVHLFFFRGDQILLIRRFNTGFADGQYSVPAGHLDGQEAAVREALEEVGVQIEEGDIHYSSVMHRLEGDERVDFFVHVQNWDGEIVNAEPEKCDEICWVNVEELPANTIPYIRRALQNHQDGIKFDEYGW